MSKTKLPDLLELAQEVQKIARQAGVEILRIYDTDFAVERKSDQSPVTAADIASEKIIKTGLSLLTPDIPILAEESADEHPYEKRKSWKYLWLVDPLDGTKEFTERNGQFTINIALILNGVPILGIVYVPVLGLMYVGIFGKGSFRIDENGQKEQIFVRSLPKIPVVAISRSHAGEETTRLLQQIGPHETRPSGSAIKMCWAAEGSVDVYPRLGQTMEWDTAAGEAVVLNAGGVVLTRDGKQMLYNKENLANPHFIVYGDKSCDWQTFLIN